MRRLAAAGLAALATASSASAHENGSHAAASETIGWTLTPEVLVPLGLTLVIYLAGLLRLNARARHGLSALRRQATLFLLGWLTLALALVSPLHRAGEVSFTMHMIEHEIIMLPAALLLVAARPGPVLLWGLPRALRRLAAGLARVRLWRSLAAPPLATAIQAAILVVWHMPALFDRALHSEGWHVAQHLSFVASALLFWSAMIPRGSNQAARLAAALGLFLTSMIGGGLGALMALDASPWYQGYARLGMTPFGLTPAEEQQLAGLIMWVPGGLFHLAAALILLARVVASPPERLDHRVARCSEAA